MIKGIVTAGGRPSAATVLALDGSGRVTAATSSDDDGRFALDVAAVRVVAKLRGPAVGLVEVPLSVESAGSPAPLTVDLPTAHPVVLCAEGEVAPELMVQLIPQQLLGADVSRMGLLVDGMSEVALATLPLSSGRLDLQLQAGRWVLYADGEAGADALGLDNLDPRRWLVERAVLADGTALPRGYVGHELLVEGACEVVLHLVAG